MTRIAVVTDSAACVPASLKAELGIREVAYELLWDGARYSDGAGMTPTDFYRRFRQARTYPTTSQPALGAFLALYERLRHECDGIVSIHVAGSLTGTARTAQMAADQTEGVAIRVVDSRTAAIAEGFVVLAAARAAAAGGDLEEVVAEAERVIQRVDLFATLKTLEHVHRGGRLGEAAALLTDHLKITPVLGLKNGRVSIAGLSRSWEQALQLIVDSVVDRARGRPVHASVFHADAIQDALWLQSEMSRSLRFAEFYLTEFTPVMGAHTGPDVLGVAFYGDD